MAVCGSARFSARLAVAVLAMLVSFSQLCRALLRQVAIEFLERAGPSALVAIARLLIKELLVVERQQSAVAVLRHRHGHERLALGCGMPGPRKDQTAVGDHLAVDAADLVMFTVLGLEAEAIAPSRAHIHLGLDRTALGLARSEPVHYFFRVCPRAEDLRRRRLEFALEGEAWLGEHAFSSTKAANRSSFSLQKRS